MAFCSNCGANVPDGNKFCANCGAPISGENEPSRSAEPNYENANPNSGSSGSNTSQNYTVSGGYRVNIRKRDIAICIILSLVTCGIYGLIWFIGIINDLNETAQTPDDKSAGMIILFTIVTCGIYGWFWLYNAGQKVDQIRQLNGDISQNSSLLYLILAIFGLSIVDYCLIQSELNKVAVLA